MNIRIISSKHCPKCKSYLTRLDKRDFDYQLYDADAPENQDQLDSWNVNELPVVQIVDSQDSVLYQFPHGEYSPRAIKAKVNSLGEKK